MALTRELPSNKIAEKYVISSALTDIASANYIINEMRADDFTDIKFRRIFEALVSIGLQNKTLNLSTILSELSELNYLDEIGGSDYINNLISDFIDIEGLEDNIRLLQDKRIAREVIVKMDDLTTDYYKNKFETDFNFLTSAEMQISEIVRTRKIDGFKGIKEVAAKIKENIELARQNDDALIGFDTGLNQLNKYTSGMQKGQMVVIAARPGVGKTALGLNICFNVAKKYKRPVLVFSAEMSEEEVFTRVLSKASNINGNKINTGQLSSDDTIKLNAAIKQISDVPLLVSYCNGVTIGEIVNKTTKFQTEHPDLAMIMIDYIGLIKTGQKEESLRIEIAKISHALKKLATDLQIPVIVVSQVRRTQESIPQMSDLRDSGDIEQDADKVILLYRDDYDNETKKKKATSTQDNQANVAAMDNKEKEASGGLRENNTSIVEAIVAKNRNGQTGTGVLLFLKSYQSFGNPTDEFIEDYKLKKKNLGVE